MLRYKDVIKPTIEAAEAIVDFEPQRGVGVAVQYTGPLSTGENVALKQMGATKDDWQSVLASDGPVQLDQDKNRIDCLSRGTFKLSKTATTNPVGVRIWYAS
jgi:hypothetical protein